MSLARVAAITSARDSFGYGVGTMLILPARDDSPPDEATTPLARGIKKALTVDGKSSFKLVKYPVITNLAMGVQGWQVSRARPSQKR